MRLRSPGGEVPGHLVTHDGIRAYPSKVKATMEVPRPTSTKEVQRFIEKCQYYRKFISNFSQIAAPLYKAQTIRRDFVWTDACDLAWTRLRKALISGAILVHPGYTRVTRIGGVPGCCSPASTR